jgi:hypothetical protein
VVIPFFSIIHKAIAVKRKIWKSQIIINFGLQNFRKSKIGRLNIFPRLEPCFDKGYAGRFRPDAYFQPLIDSGILVKVTDEEGISIEDKGAFGECTNTIENVKTGKGYMVNVSDNCKLIIN